MPQPWPIASLKKLRDAGKILDRIGKKLIAERKHDILRERLSGVEEKLDTVGKDLLTLLIRANLQDPDGMSDSDVCARGFSPSFSGSSG